ncbi:RNase A-like domain-containing protein [Streptomyces salinarius]|uniref:RNase A-like domain-containing protein n=1 Tax=Streptomyces salinarius TaxID=2762598 RepID=UPI001F088DA2|nr:RNase A-like domain-containing protein [Streptomyces salinarius]
MRNRLRNEPQLDADSRFLREADAQCFADETMLRNQKRIDSWLQGRKSKLTLDERFKEATGLRMTRYDFKHGIPPREGAFGPCHSEAGPWCSLRLPDPDLVPRTPDGRLRPYSSSTISSLWVLSRPRSLATSSCFRRSSCRPLGGPGPIPSRRHPNRMPDREAEARA